jgi:NAD dependent epimerase/dehydratase
MAKILITGAGGFIGSHLTEYLDFQGHDVIAFVRYTSSGTAGLLDTVNYTTDNPGFNIVQGDIRNQSDVFRAAEGCDYIIHLAAQIAIPWSYISPHEFVSTNVMGTLNVLMAAKKFKVKRMIAISTSEIYGTAQYKPMDEKHPLVSQSPYSASKIAAEKMAQAFHRSFETPVVIVRPFNAFGPRQSNRAVIPSIVLQVLSGKKEIMLGSLTARRDFNYVTDVVENLTKILFSEFGTGREYNLCSGMSYSLSGIVERVGTLMGVDLIPVLDDQRVRPKHSEVDELIGDGDCANELFGLPQRTDIMEGLKQTIRYFEENKKEEKFTL